MKILFLNDSHISGVNSVNRKGDYFADCMLKLEETIKLSKKCDFVIHAGDLFHTAIVANTIVDEVLDRIEETGIPWYILPGNHDMIGANWENSEGTSLNHIFRRSKCVFILKEMLIKDVYIKGYPYYHNCEQDIKDNGLIHKQPKYFTIAVTHAFISPEKFRDDVLHVEIKDIKTNFDCILCSHFHNDSGIIKKGKTSFINVGAWGRRSISEGVHRPKIIMIDTEKRSYDLIELKSAKNADEIFDLNAKEELKNNEKELSEFINSLKDFHQQEMDLRGTIELIAKQQKIERPVIDQILEKLTEVEQNEKV